MFIGFAFLVALLACLLACMLVRRLCCCPSFLPPQVLIAIFLFGDDLGILKAFGMIVTLSGLLGYAFFKNWRNKKEIAAAAAAAASADGTTADNGGIELVRQGGDADPSQRRVGRPAGGRDLTSHRPPGVVSVAHLADVGIDMSDSSTSSAGLSSSDEEDG